MDVLFYLKKSFLVLVIRRSLNNILLDIFIYIAEVRTAEGKLYLYVAIDRTSKFAYAELHKSQTKMIAAEFLRNLIKAVPYKINKVLTDNGIQFTNHDHHKNAFTHIF